MVVFTSDDNPRLLTSASLWPIDVNQKRRFWKPRSAVKLAGTTPPLSHHYNSDASQVDGEPDTQLRATNHQDEPIRVSQPRNAYPSRDGTTSSDRNIVPR